MALIECKECGIKVSAGANSCPICGTHRSGRRKLLMILGVIFIGGTLANLKMNNDQHSGNGAIVPTTTAVPPEKINESCAKFADVFGYDSKMTSVQKDEMWESKYKEKRFQWTVQVVSVESTYDEDYDVTFACLPASRHPALLKMFYPKENRAKVLKFNTGMPYSIAGVLKDYEVPPIEFASQVSVRITAEPLESADTEANESRSPAKEEINKEYF